jgi:hypothetical protein
MAAGEEVRPLFIISRSMGFFFSLLGANVAIVANAAAGIVRTGEAAHDLHTCQDELLVSHVPGVRVSDVPQPLRLMPAMAAAITSLKHFSAPFVVFIVFIGL